MLFSLFAREVDPEPAREVDPEPATDYSTEDELSSEDEDGSSVLSGSGMEPALGDMLGS